MSKKIVLNAELNKREAERSKQREEKAEYLGNIADKVLDAIEKVFAETTPSPTSNDMIDVISLTSVFLFARQIGICCKSKKTMKSIMKSAMWALTNQIEDYAEPFINKEEPWSDLLNEEGGDDGRAES